MPKMSDTMTEGVIAAWNKKVGDVVKSGDILAEIETDKATMDMESYYDGTLLYIGVEKGQAVPVDAIMAVIGKPGEDYQSLISGNNKAATPSAEPAPVAETLPVAATPAVDTSNIKAKVVTMPLLSDTMTEEAGQAAKINAVIAVIGEEGANYQALLSTSTPVQVPSATPAVTEVSKVVTSTPIATSPTDTPIQASNNNGRILASPLAKKMAEEKGIKLTEVSGSGEGGRIVKSDVDNFKPKAVETKSATSDFTILPP
eukprot:gene5638-7654_t